MSAAPTVICVALPVPLRRLFDYLAPAGHQPEAKDIGRRIRVPFGPRELVGIVTAISTAEPEKIPELRQALTFLDPEPILQNELLDSLRWLAHYTHAPLGEVLATALPVTLRHGNPLPDTRTWAWRLTRQGIAELSRLRQNGRPRRLAEYLLVNTNATEDRLDEFMASWRDAARSLVERGYLERVPATIAQQERPSFPGPIPNIEQQIAIDAIAGATGFAPFLLDGITGSGKTEVYLHAIRACLASGKQALVLVPEIGLTPQMLARFHDRLGIPIHALHSGLSDNERTRVWLAAQRGQARVIVGTRSAVFTPLPEAGLIVIDEEHDSGYKQQDGIRYHARDFALVRGKALNIPILLGSATPSLESLHNARSSRYISLRLRERAGDARTPQVRILDVRKRPLHAGLAPETLEAITTNLSNGGQVLVFKNRRGYAPVLLCHDCGWNAQCPRCDTPMTLHANSGKLLCHHCGSRQARPPACPACGSLALQPQGIGTERLEESLIRHFPDIPVLRIDRDTTQRRDGLTKLLQRLGDHPGILVGTQILAKGHDLPNLTLVVVVGIDEGLFSSDFRTHEKLAQQLLQVAGRAGRAKRSGEVWWQTHHPDHPLLYALIHGGYHAFAEDELPQRQAAGFPPFTHLALLRAEARHAEAALSFLHAAKRRFEIALTSTSSPTDSGEPVSLYGPVTAPMPRRAGLHRVQLLLSTGHRPSLHRLLEQTLIEIEQLPQARKTRWSLDIDPTDLY
ncbi:MAG: primosomal protein N' [Xanthomonadaceae bacterium]|jgi:primosomal protein N' (replication factor Y)|nr:primosomal protein N' [Xanthomonadaceae bacterium]